MGFFKSLPLSAYHATDLATDGHANGIIKQPAQPLAAMSVSDPAAAAFFPSPLALFPLLMEQTHNG